MAAYSCQVEVSYAQAQRIRRLAVMGRCVKQIHRQTGISETAIVRILGRMPDMGYRRCPGCGAMARLPCIACAIRNGLRGWPLLESNGGRSATGTEAPA